MTTPWTRPEHPAFAGLRQRYEQLEGPSHTLIQAFYTKRREILDRSLPLRLGGFLTEHRAAPSIAAGVLGAVLAHGLDPLGEAPVFGFFAGCGVGAGLLALLARASDRLEERVLQHHASELAPFEQARALAEREFAEIRDSYEREHAALCEVVPTYPPDWNDRRRAALRRDGFQCTKCGWPDGAKRRTRELHVHHIISLANGGTNALDNLTTLCHICHRGVDSAHAGVKKLNSARDRRRRRRWHI